MPALWTSNLMRNFHNAVETLEAITKNPSDEVAYSTALPGTDAAEYILRSKDELQLADHIAFLAHSQEGVQSVSAACVEERHDAFIIRLASNHTPSAFTVNGLQEMLRDLSDNRHNGTSKDTLQELIFNDVLNLSQDRILQRIRPSWVACPDFYQRPEAPLWIRIEAVLTRLRSNNRRRLPSTMLSKLKSLISSMRMLERRLYGQPLRDVIKAIIRRCAELSYGEGHGCLETQLKRTPGAQHIARMREVVQIDKLARYFGLCKDLAKISHRILSRGVVRRITLEAVVAPDAVKPIGASRECHVHAEVQLILYYERHSATKRPRAIGCSKSACFLCDMLIQKLGKFCISYSHRRIYPQWTLPNARWMTTEQVAYFRSILNRMVADMSSLADELRTRKKAELCRPFGLESRAVLLLSSNSSLDNSSREQPGAALPSILDGCNAHLTLSQGQPSLTEQLTMLSDGTENDDAEGSFATELAAPSSLSLPSVFDLDNGDLPHHQWLGQKMITTYLDLDDLFLVFECPSIPSGTLTIRRLEGSEAYDKEDVQCIQVIDIPTTEVTLKRSSLTPSTIKLRLQMGRGADIVFEIVLHDTR